MIKYYTESHIEYNVREKGGKMVRCNDSVSSVDIKKAYVKYGGIPTNEITLKYPDWFGARIGYHSLGTDRKKGLVLLPLCDSPEEYILKAKELRV